jgi:S1-C subfamily serine protease
MMPKKQTIALAIGLLTVTLVLLGLASLMPDAVSRLSYAAERGKAQAAREQLARANDLTEAFHSVADAMRPSVVSISSVKKIRPAIRQPDHPFGQWPEEYERFFGGVLVWYDVMRTDRRTRIEKRASRRRSSGRG